MEDSNGTRINECHLITTRKTWKYVMLYNIMTSLKWNLLIEWIKWRIQMNEPMEWMNQMKMDFFVIKEFDSLLVTRSSYVNDDVIIKIIN